jgi:hypothetical protein
MGCHRYKVEMLVTRGGGLSRGNADPSHPTDGLKEQLPPLPPSRLKDQMYSLMTGKDQGRDRDTTEHMHGGDGRVCQWWRGGTSYSE